MQQTNSAWFDYILQPGIVKDPPQKKNFTEMVLRQKVFLSVCISVAMRQRAADSKGESISMALTDFHILCSPFQLNVQPCPQIIMSLSQTEPEM